MAIYSRWQTSKREEKTLYIKRKGAQKHDTRTIIPHPLFEDVLGKRLNVFFFESIGSVTKGEKN